MKLVLVGLGNFGQRWYKNIKENYHQLKVSVVDMNTSASEKLTDKNDKFYTSLIEAIIKEQPDFILNITPPDMHASINNIAFDYKLPVLCEKPISVEEHEAIEIVERAQREDMPFMISENYRRRDLIRKAHKLISDDEIGDILSIKIDLYKNYKIMKPYLLEMEHPLLEDCAVHIFDMIRYLTRNDGRRIFAKGFRPNGTWFNGKPGLTFILEMENGCLVTFNGSLAAQGIETSWLGTWCIEGTKGLMCIENDNLILIKNNEELLINDFSDVDKSSCLDEFLSSLEGKRKPETHAADYLKSQLLVFAARKSCSTGDFVDINNSVSSVH